MWFLLVGSYLIDLDLLQRMLMDLSENEKFKIGDLYIITLFYT